MSRFNSDGSLIVTHVPVSLPLGVGRPAPRRGLHAVSPRELHRPMGIFTRTPQLRDKVG